MRKIVSALGALALACSANAQTRPSFSFKGITANVQRNTDNLSSVHGCHKAPVSAVWTCDDINSSYAGVVSILTEFIFNAGYLSAMISEFPSDKYLTVVEAFQAKYGPPCRQTTETWQSAISSLPNAVTVWCFDTGELTLKQFGHELGLTQVIYLDSVHPLPADKPKVDF